MHIILTIFFSLLWLIAAFPSIKLEAVYTKSKSDCHWTTIGVAMFTWPVVCALYLFSKHRCHDDQVRY